MYLGISAQLGFFSFCLAGALVIALAPGRRAAFSEESAVIGIVQAFALACGFLFVSLYHGLLSGIAALLFGSFVGITDGQVLTLLLVAVLAVALVAIVGRPLLFASLDPDAYGDPVDWAGPGPAPVWLDLAREYTERWHHQQQIRDATGRPGLKEPRYLAPVLDTFVRALPRAYREVEAADDTLVTLEITGAAGNRWHLLRESGAWQLYLDADQTPAVSVSLDEDLAWRLFTKGVKPEAARADVVISGDERLALPALGMISIIG